GVFMSKDQPLKRAELALKIMPGEHAHELVSAVSSAMRAAVAGSVSALAVNANADDGDRVRAIYQRIDAVLESIRNLLEAAVVQSARGKQLLSDAMQRVI